MPPTTINSFSLSSTIGIGTYTPNQALTVVGNISSTGTVYASAVQIGATSPIATLNVSPLTITGAASGSVFNQIQNTVAGVSASTDVALYNDLLTNYVDIGINSSTYNGNIYSPKFNIVGPNDSYFFATSGNVSIGNTGSTGDLIFHTGGSLSGTAANSGNERMRIVNSNTATTGGFIGINTSTPNQQLTVAGTISASTAVYANGVLLGSGGGSNVSGLSGNWQNTYTTVSSNSANWNAAYNNQSNYLPLSGGVLIGNLTVNASFAAQTKSFLIDHPSTKNKKLQYGSLESPYHGIRLTGKGIINGRVAVINLPKYIKNLVHCDDVNIQLTNINHSKVLYIKTIDIQKNKFTVGVDTVKTEIPNTYEFFWSFTAIRKDVPNLIVEV